jgi:hypothetical protein
MEDERLRDAVQKTEVLRSPRQSLATFGTTNINYYLLTEPVYSELKETEETAVREGRIGAQRPRVVTPSYLSRLEGFSENAGEYLRMLMEKNGPHAPALFYSYKNELRGLTIVSDKLDVVAGRLKEKVDRQGDRLTAIIQGVDELWDISLLKFITELTERSLRSNIFELGRRGFLSMDDAGIPGDARYVIENLFQKVRREESGPSELKKELDRWNLFSEYEDRFLNLFRKH